ncbi:MAG: hypothetical protein R3A12_02670 [Ignavibacteria bacterium]
MQAQSAGLHAGSLTEILSYFERIGEAETIELVKNRYSGINILRERLSDEKNRTAECRRIYELINGDHLDSLERIDEINNKLKFIFRILHLKYDKLSDQ